MIDADADQYELFQAVRLLEAEAHAAGGALELGDDAPGREPVRFRVESTLSFPPAHVSRLRRGGRRGTADDGVPELLIYAYGLTGPGGTLPRHYTSLLVERTSLEHKDFAMAEFFDLFNNRATALYVRAWEKYRFPFAYERAARRSRRRRAEADAFTQTLFSVAGVAQAEARSRTPLPELLHARFAGLLGRRVRTAAGLETIIEDVLGVPCEVREFRSRWLQLPPSEQTALGRANASLGESAAAGNRAEDVHSLVRAVLRPPNAAVFARLLPGGEDHETLQELAKRYLSPSVDCEFQLILRSEDAPPPTLSKDDPMALRLGRTGWSGRLTPGVELDDVVIRAAC